jgi:nucleotide-binding universal stress UspA family protein
MERILTAVDFSECSRRALQGAVELARAFESRLRVVYVDPERFEHLDPSEAEEPRRLRTARLSQELDAFITEDFKGEAEELERVERQVLAGVPHTALLEETDRWQASLLVAGTHGRSALERFLLGSVSNKLLHLAKVPLLIVPEFAHPRPGKILAAVDLGSATRVVLRTAAAWCAGLGAELTVVHVLDQLPEPVLFRLFPESEIKPTAKQVIDQRRGDVELAVKRFFPPSSKPRIDLLLGPPAREICRHVEEGEYDLVIAGVHEKHGLLDFGNTAARIAHRSPCSILIARPRASEGSTDA